MSFKDKVAWITGASSGIGEALAVELAGRGALVVLSGRRKAELERVAARIAETGGPSRILPFDATAYDTLPGIAAEARDWHGRVDLLVNNAGISQRSLALDTTFEVYRELMEVDFFAPVRLTQLVLPGMVERRSGHIAIVSSVAGKFGTPLRTGYCAAKHACIGYYDALRSEVEAAYSIAVSTIVPGSVQTAIAVNAVTGDGSKRGRTDANIAAGMTAERAATIIADGLAAGRREIPVAKGNELAMLNARAGDPEALFARMAQEGARLAKMREVQGPARTFDSA